MKKKQQLVQISIPPHRQSIANSMDCHLLYVQNEIKGNRLPGGMEAARGTEIHRTMAAYALHCKERRVSMDLDAFERFRQGAGPHAAKILAGLRDGYQVDYMHLLATELTLRLDGNYRPTSHATFKSSTQVVQSLLSIGMESIGKDPVEFEGTLDSLYAFRDQNRMLIEDYKSNPRPYEPADPARSMQGIEYTVFVMMHFPWVQVVTFRLVFCRYRNCIREVNYTRADLPKLIDALRASRQLQKSIHEDYDKGKPIEATPGSHCNYCALLTPRTCPISEWVPQAQHKMEDRLRFLIWYSEFSKANTKVLKDNIDATGRSIIVNDGNGRPYKYGPVDITSKVYPIFERDDDTGKIALDHQDRPFLPIIDRLMDHAHENPDDTDWMLKLVISSTKMNSALSANKRMHLDQALKDEVYLVSRPQMKVTRPVEPEEEEYESDEEDEEGSET